MSLVKLYDDWLPYKDVFARPTLKFHIYIEKIPMKVPICSRRRLFGLTKLVAEKSMIKVGTKSVKYGDKTYLIDQYESSRHTLPGGLHEYDRVWNSEIRKKLRKYHLSWMQPIITIPWFFRFEIGNRSMIWKTKYDEYRFELPPRFSLTLFGITFEWTLEAPKSNLAKNFDDFYWEAILNYGDSHSIKDCIDKVGIWIDKSTKFFGVRPNYFTEENQSNYHLAVLELRKRENCNIL